jgi:anti-anti-sigma regulatory factor
VNDTSLKSSSLSGTTEAAVDCVSKESAGNPFQPAPVIEQIDQPSGAESSLKITGEQTIRTADELHKTLAGHLDRGLAVVVDLSEIIECDTAALQLIYALRQSAVQRKQRFHITAVSPAIAETAAALGLHIEALTTANGRATADSDCGVAHKDNGI